MHAPTQQAIELVRCKGCPHTFGKLIGSRGPIDSPLVIVGESPGTNELKQGIPFCGPSGKVLDHALAQHPDISPYITNAIQCFPGTVKSKSQDRITQATQCCQSRLHGELRKSPRQVILALGNPAVWSTTGEFGAKITQCRGQLVASNLSERGIVLSVHPAYLLRGQGSMRQFMADVDYACRLSKGADTKRYILPEVHVAKTPDNIKWLTQQIAAQLYCAADIETGGYEGFDHLRDRILCCGFSWDPLHVYVVPEELIQFCFHIFRSCPSTRFIWHNGKFDTKFFWKLGIPCRVDEDTMLLSYAIDETKGIHDLEQLSGDILGAPDWKFMINEYTKPKGNTYADIPPDILYDYMARDISGTMQIFPFLRNLVRLDPHLERLYTKTLIPMSKYLARIEMNGIQPDLKQVQSNAERLQKVADNLELEFNQQAVAAGFGALNPRSPQQVGALLYDKIGLRDPRRPKKRPDSTDEKTLLTLSPHPIVTILLKYREVQKALGTYVNSVPNHIGADRRIHCSYLIHGTTTGRLASRDPNLLNIPRDPPLRGQFISSPDHMFMEIDVSQAELRVLAELSGDPVLYEIYTTPGHPSIHLVTQREMFGDPKQYSQDQWQFFMDKFSTENEGRTLEEQNMRAKCVNFGIVYGRTAPSIAEEFKMPVAEAQEWIDKWFQKYAVARTFILSCRAAPLKGQNLITPFGRKRRFQIVNQERLNDIQNQAANFPEQSIASDIVTHVGMLIQDEAHYKYSGNLVNTVYDSLLFEMPNDLDRALQLGARCLELLSEVPKLWGLNRIPFVGDIKIGRRWGSDPENKYPEMGYLQKVKMN